MLLCYSNLEELYLVDNSIKRLFSFPKNFPELQILDVRNNKIANCEELVSIERKTITHANKAAC